jgi:putative flippase GtrA
MKEKFKYLLSSGVAFIIDYILLMLLDSVLPAASLEIGAFLAWIVSSLTNFFLNRNFVFMSQAPLKKALPEYYGLAGIVFVLKTYVVLEFLIRLIGIPLKYSKLIEEVIFFVSNYIIQKLYIFTKNKK